MITEALLRVKGLVLLPILTKQFGAVNYGVWTQVSVLAGMLAPGMILSTDAALLRFLPGADASQKQKGFSTIVTYIGVVTIFVTLFLWVTAPFIAEIFFQDRHRARFVAICGPVILVNLGLNLCRNWYRIDDRAKALCAVNLIQSISNVAVTVFIAISGRGIYELVVIMTSVDCLIMAVVLSDIARGYGVARPELSLFVKYARFGLPLVPYSYFMWILNASDQLFISYYHGVAALGIYRVAYALGYFFIEMLFNPIWVMYPARAAELYNSDKRQELTQLFRYSTQAALGLIIPAVVGTSMLAVPILKFLSTPEFTRGAGIISVITIAYTFHLIGSFYMISLKLVEKNIYITLSTVISAAAHLALNWALIPRWDITGAAYATCLAFGIQMALSIFWGARQLHLCWNYSFILKSVFASGSMAVVISWLKVDSIPQLALAILSSAGVYLIFMALLQSFALKQAWSFFRK